MFQKRDICRRKRRFLRAFFCGTDNIFFSRNLGLGVSQIFQGRGGGQPAALVQPEAGPPSPRGALVPLPHRYPWIIEGGGSASQVAPLVQPGAYPVRRKLDPPPPRGRDERPRRWRRSAVPQAEPPRLTDPLPSRTPHHITPHHRRRSRRTAATRASFFGMRAPGGRGTR